MIKSIRKILPILVSVVRYVDADHSRQGKAYEGDESDVMTRKIWPGNSRIFRRATDTTERPPHQSQKKTLG